jgi:phenylalanyl-tRNA synthetase alpha chain
MRFPTGFLLLLTSLSRATGFSLSNHQHAGPLHNSLVPTNANSYMPSQRSHMKNSMELYMSDTSSEAVSIDSISKELQGHKEAFDAKIASVETVTAAEAVRVEYLGKKGPINKVMGYMRLLSNEEKPKLGSVVNEIKSSMEETVASRMEELEMMELSSALEKEKIDVTLPGLIQSQTTGRRHPLSITMEKALDIFTSLGYDTVTECADSPEIETDYFCFEALNCPKDHPARDMQDTFYLTEDMGHLLRTHTSSVQIRQLAKRKPPLRMVAPGRVYRKDDIDATHSLIFHQIEILAIDKRGELNLGHLKGTVEYFLKEMFGPDIKVRFRGSYFPFTEPSMEVDVFFRGKWLEVLGCGMVDPNVLEMAGLDPEEYSGFAAGFGVERFAMVIHQITDIREFYKSDLRFLQQFPTFYDAGLKSQKEGSTQTSPETKTENEVVQSESKAEEKPKQEKQEQSTESTDIDVSKLDIRVGVIKKAWVHEEAEKLFCEEIDIGEAEPRQIASGLRAHYNLEDLEGQRVLVLANLKSRKLVGFPSHGMVLCAASEDGSKVEFIEPPAGAAIGERVTVEGFDGEAATENQVIKKKMLDVIFPDLKTDSSGVATYKGVALSTSAGPCTAQKGMPNSPVG